MDETLFYVFGIALAVLAVAVSFVGLKAKRFPGKLGPLVVAVFLLLAAGSATFAVLHAQEEKEHREHEYEMANEEIEKEQSGGPDEEEEAEHPSGEAEPESEAGESDATGSAEAGAEVFASSGCASCHTFAAAGSTGVTGPDLDEALTADDDRVAIEEMIVEPDKEIVSGYASGIMPATFGESLSDEELADLVEFIYVNSAAGTGA